ncbi:hypothetical protein GJ496_004065 [Pomphorhynchus laevis]|nr:hypothetical protein GJ496_004065 [Pomphorhynchus laevis]
MVFTKPEHCEFKQQFSNRMISCTIPSISLQHSNRAANAVNSFLQFLFQELKDTGQVRRYFIRKIKIELDELTKRKVLSSIIRNIEIRDFDMGGSSPEFNALSLRDCKYDSTGLLETVQIYTHIKYCFGFSLSIAVDTLIEKSAVFSFKLDKFESDAYFVLCREPFTHWYLSFSRDPSIDMNVSTHVGARNIPQLANLIANHLKKAILRKHVWPAYKVRFRPFFFSPPSLEIDDEIATSPIGPPLFKIFLNCIPFEILTADIRCIDRLSDSYADTLAKPKYKFHQQLVTALVLSEISVYDEISGKKLFDNIDKYPNLRRIQLPRGLNDCFKLSEIDVFRCPFIYVTKANKSIERLLEVGDVLLQVNNQRLVTIEQFNMLYTDKLISDSLTIIVKKVKVTPQMSTQSRNNKGKDTAEFTLSDIEDAVRGALSNMDFWFSPDQLARMHFSQPKVPGKFVNFDEQIALKLHNSDVFCNVLLFSSTENSGPTILAYTCFTLEEIVYDCDLTLKRECQFSRSLFPADFVTSQGLGNAIFPQGFAHTMAHGNIVIGFRLIENIDTINIETLPLDQQTNEMSTSNTKLNSIDFSDVDDTFIVHQLRPFRADTTQYCKICNGKIWMKNALRCNTCGVLCHQKCASGCYLTRCQGFGYIL